MFNNNNVVVIILDYNRPKLTNTCLETIWKYNRIEIVLVNSGSTNYSEYNAEIPFHYVTNTKNRSFSTGMNVGLKYASKLKPKYVIFLNNDAIVTEKAIQLLVTALDLHPEIGMVSSGYAYSLGYLTKRKPLDLNDIDYREPIIKKRKKLTGFCLCVRFEVISTIGGYDENFIFTKEDDDLSYRIVGEGYTLAEVENSVVIHKITSSLNLSSTLDVKFLITSLGFGMGLLVRKNEGNIVAMFFDLLIQDMKLFIKIVVVAHRINFNIFKWSLSGYINGHRRTNSET